MERVEQLIPFIMKGNPLNIGDSSNKTGEVISLKHPKSGCMKKFLLIDDMIHEITYFQQNKSIFIDEYVKSDGKLLFSAPIDPVFLVLPYLKSKSANKFSSLKELLFDEDYPDLKKIISCNGLKYLCFAADEENEKYKYNEEKLMNWLEKKFEQVFQVLQSRRSGVSWTTDALVKEAKGIISAYIDSDINMKFSTREMNSSLLKRKSTSALVSENAKKSKS